MQRPLTPLFPNMCLAAKHEKAIESFMAVALALVHY
jgi:hypothetical protein